MLKTDTILAALDRLFPSFSATAKAAPATKVTQEKLVLAVLPKLAVQILDYARDHSRVTMSDMVRQTGASRNTAAPMMTHRRRGQ
jgi:hypothetical protein